MFDWLKKINPFAETEDKVRKQYQSEVERINHLEAEYEQLSDTELRLKTDDFRNRLADGETLDDVLPEAFAAVREASRRTIGMRHYDVQLIGGIVLHQGRIAEMKTGEGKTLVATLPLYLNALTGKGAHLVTVNDYLARRDAGWMGPIYNLLGMSIGFIGHDFSALFDPEYVDPSETLEDERLVHWRPCSRREAYHADITYGTNNEFGFDYLRDNMVHSFKNLSQREHHYAIVDEVDNILIDEARTPLIISGPASKSSDQYARFAQLVTGLRAGRVSPDEVKKGAEPDGDALIDLKTRSVVLTEQGLEKVEAQIEELGTGESVYDPQHALLTHYLENALKAKFIFHRDKDYVVQEGEVIIVDEFTGRLMPGRRWSDGLHQAVEAKEGVQVQRESTTYATVTFQNYFRMYEKLAGMTGTAETEREEFAKIYDLDVTVIPTNKPCIREDHADLIYRTEEAKFKAVINDIWERTAQGQPILVGTTAVETSERLSNQIMRDLGTLIRSGEIDFHVLNAKQNADEAAIIAQAGKPATVTIATNMAGRGTDILLGGNPESLASRHLREIGFTREELQDLAESLFGSQKKGPMQSIIARSDGRLTEDLITALQHLQASYEQAMQQIEERGENLYLVQTVLDDIPPDYYEEKRELVRAILEQNMLRARKIVHDTDAIGEEKIGEIQRVYLDVMQYRNNRRQRPDFLAEKLFERVYTARARLVQLVLRGDIEQAQQLVEATPGLPAEYIDDVLDIQRQCEEDHEYVKQNGGLHVIGTERHEARRIDNQLRGRAGRQGDQGSSRFYLSLEDDLMKRFGRMDTLKGVMEKMGVEDDQPIESNLVSKSIEKAQERVEGFNFDGRKHTVDYDDVMNKQREIIYARRRRILDEAEEQHRLETLIERYYKPDQLLREIRDELRKTADSLPAELVQARLARILTHVSFDVETLRASSDEELQEILVPMIEQQQQESMHVMLDELFDIIDLPEDAEDRLPTMNYEEALAYVTEQWREQREGDLEERIKSLFDSEFERLVDRYLHNYESWLREQIREAVADATNPANDEVNVSLVTRRLLTIMPEVEELETEDMTGFSAEALQKMLEGWIAENIDNGQNIILLVREIRSFIPLLPDPQVLTPGSNMSQQAREQIYEQYIQQYAQRYKDALAPLTAGLPEDEQQRIEQKAIGFLREQARPLLTASSVSQEARTNALKAIISNDEDVLFEIIDQMEADTLLEILADVVDRTFDRWRERIGMEQLSNFQRTLMLQTIDREWQEYLTAMEAMRQGIGLQAIGQRDPLVQYKTTAFRMFSELQENIDHTIVHGFFQQLPNYQRHIEAYKAEMEKREKATQAGYEMVSTGKTDKKGTKKAQQPTIRRDAPKIGPNEPCPCGSGKKYKYCHGRPEGAAGTTSRGRQEAELVGATNSGETMASATAESPNDAPPAQGKPKGRGAPSSAQSASRSSGGGGGGGGSRNKKKKKAKR
jgi:preprotein translocase SecA subunit